MTITPTPVTPAPLATPPVTPVVVPPAPQYVYVGEGIHKIKTLAVVDHAKIKNDVLSNLEQAGVAMVRDIIKNQAISMRYDSPESLCSYAGYLNTYQKEAMSFIAWRGAVWDWVQKYMVDVASGVVIPPSDLTKLATLIPVYAKYVVV